MAPTTRVDSSVARDDRAARRVQGDRRRRRDRRARRVHRLDPTRARRFGRRAGVVPRDGRRTARVDRRRRQARARAARQGGRIAAVGERDAAAQLKRPRARSTRCESTARRCTPTSLGDNRSIALAREAVAIDSTFASAWSALGAMLSNYGGTRSAIDSALTQAYRYRDRLPAIERDRVVARYYGLGPGRDRAKAIAAYESILQHGDSERRRPGQPRRDAPNAPRLRARRVAQRPGARGLARAAATGLGNAIEMQLDQGKFNEAAATAARIGEISRLVFRVRARFT